MTKTGFRLRCKFRIFNNRVYKYSKEFFDGDRKYGYGGYKYLPNRWNDVVSNIQEFYNLDKHSKILDAGAGKGFFIKDLQDRIHSNKIYGFDISEYAVKHCHNDIRDNFFVHDIRKKLEFNDKYFDVGSAIDVELLKKYLNVAPPKLPSSP